MRKFQQEGPEMSVLHEFTIEGHKLAAITANPDQPGMPVILVHGAVASINSWTPDLLEPFLPYGPCTSLSLPGHFPAVFPAGMQRADLTSELIARLTSAAVRRITGNRSALLVGHSTGAFAILAAAAADPELARGVLSISGFAQGRWSTWLAAYQWLACHDPLGKAAFWLLFSLGANRTLFRLTAGFHTPAPSGGQPEPGQPDPTEENYQVFCSFSREAMQCYFARMREMDILPQLAKIRAPALAVAGSADLAIPPAQARLIASAIPGGECVYIRGARHHPFYEKPAAYRAAVEAWLKRCFA